MVSILIMFWQDNVKGTAIFITFRPDYAIMHFYYFLSDRKSKSNTAVFPACRTVCLVKPIKNKGKFVSGNAGACIINADLDTVPFFNSRYCNFSFFRRELYCINNNICDGSAKSFLIPAHLRKWVDIPYNRDFFSFKLWLYILEDFFDGPIYRYRLNLQFQSVAFKLCNS